MNGYNNNTNGYNNMNSYNNNMYGYNNNMNGYNNYNDDDDKKFNFKIIIIVVFIILLILFSIFFFTSKGEKNDDPKEKDTDSNEKALLDNISKEFNCNLLNNACMIIVTNNNDENINLIGKNVVLHDLNKNEDIYEKTPIYANGLGAHEVFYIPIFISTFDLNLTSFDADFSLQNNFKTRNHIDDISFTDKNDPLNEEIIMNVRNNADEDIDSFQPIVFFYKNNKLVAVKRSKALFNENGELIYGIKRNEEISVKFDYPIGKDFTSKVDFDRYEIIVNEAYTKYDEKNKE